jgi:hypothetical protein
MPDGFTVDPDELATHQKHVETAADQLREAHSAARSVAMPTEAYGKICQFFPPKLDPAENEAIGTLQAAVEAFTNLATSLDSASRGYDNQDTAARDTFHQGLR